MLEIPSLHTKDYHQIASEAGEWIAGYSKEWTNLNPSDPGVTLLELFSWVADTLYYQIDDIPLETYRNFLRMVTGYEPSELSDALEQSRNIDPNLFSILEFQKELEDIFDQKRLEEFDLTELKKRVESFMNSRYRAVTLDDYERLAVEATSGVAPEGGRVARAFAQELPGSGIDHVKLHVLPELSFLYQKSFLTPGLTSPVVFEGEPPVPETGAEGARIISSEICKSSYLYTLLPGAFDESALISRVTHYLAPRRLLGAPLDVSLASFSELEVSFVAVFQSLNETKTGVWETLKRVAKFLDPLSGGPDQKGWPWGRSVTISELSKLIEETPGVAHVKSVELKDSSGVALSYLKPQVLPRLMKATIRAEALYV